MDVFNFFEKYDGHIPLQESEVMRSIHSQLFDARFSDSKLITIITIKIIYLLMYNIFIVFYYILYYKLLRIIFIYIY